MFRISLLLGLSLGLFISNSFAQSSNITALHDLNEYALERLQVLNSDFGGIHPSIRPYRRNDLRSYLNYAQENGLQLSIDTSYLLNDNNDLDSLRLSRKPFLKYLYRSPAHLYEVRVPNFFLSINPMLDIQGGVDLSEGKKNLVLLNRRGIQLRGNIDDKVYFYTDIIESQASYPTYVQNRIAQESAIPGAGYYKTYDSRLTTNPNDGVDFLQSQGYIGFNASKHIGMQLGHGRHFIGDGHRSLFLSDFSNNYFYLQLNTRVWKIHYQNTFAELVQNYVRGADQVLPKKYMAIHYLSINILKNLNVGLFESVVFGRKQGLELQYLNPIILYRTVEQGLGSPDNVILGGSFRYDFLKHFQLYGQVVIDEFVFSKAFASSTDPEKGWWANKQGMQAGLKYMNVAGLKNLDLQVEYNTVRPYTYTFRDSSANFTHYNQPLAHPLGANFREFISILRYQPIQGLHLRAQVNYAKTGLDTLGSNWGSNVHKSYNKRQQDYGNKIGQGVATNILIGQINASYAIRHNLFVDLNLMYRKQDAALDFLDQNNTVVSFGIRMNMAGRMNDF